MGTDTPSARNDDKRRPPPQGGPVLLGPGGEPVGKEKEKPALLDSTGVAVPKEPEPPEEPEGKPEPSEDEKEAEELQKKVDPLDHAIAELLMLQPGITNPEIGDQVGLSENQVWRRRQRPLFLRYMIWLRKPGIEIIRAAEKKAAQVLNNALEATQGIGKSVRPDWWIRIAAARHITDMTIGRKGILTLEDRKADIPGVPQDEIPELARGLVSAYEKAGAVVIQRLNRGKPKDPEGSKGREG